MPGLLVSVRSADEARSALAGGATVIDIKEPARGPLGRANADIWRDVVEAVGEAVPVSAALGEIADWRGLGAVEARTWRKLAYCKLGLAGAGEGWERAWSNVVTESRESPTAPPPTPSYQGRRPERTEDPTRHPPPATRHPVWIAVVYADWRAAAAPGPDAILDAALRVGCGGILVDSWEKSRPSPLNLSWGPWIQRARAGGLRVALAGGLDEAAIRRLAPLKPDLFAVRGAACGPEGRMGTVDPESVARLVRVARLRPPP